MLLMLLGFPCPRAESSGPKHGAHPWHVELDLLPCCSSSWESPAAVGQEPSVGLGTCG